MLAEDIIITGKRAIARSYAKINLTLDVLARRPNGYHDIQMIMQTVSLFDLVIVDKTADDNITISTNLRYLPNNQKNIAYLGGHGPNGIQQSLRLLLRENGGGLV